jgi:hypothetical protein
MGNKTFVWAGRLLTLLVLAVMPVQVRAQAQAQVAVIDATWINATCQSKEEKNFARYYVTGEQVYVRNSPRGFVLGTLFKRNNKSNADRFDVQFISPKGWAWGYGYGNFNGFGWVKLWQNEVPAGSSGASKGDLYLRPTGFTAPARYPCHRQISPSEFAFAKNSTTLANGRESKSDGSKARIIGSAVPIYGTYRDTQGLYRRVAERDGRYFDARGFGPLDSTRRVLWRYITRDRRFVLMRVNDIRSNGTHIEDKWGFVPRCNVVIPGREAEEAAQCGPR